MNTELQQRLDILREADAKRLSYIENAIKNGVAFLDRKAPGWASRIDTSRLSMRHPKDNLLAQLGLRLSSEEEIEKGFYLNSSEIMEDGQSNFAWLNILWKEEIAKRI